MAFLGISLAGYNVLVSLVIAAIAAYGLLAATTSGMIRRLICRSSRRMP